MLVLFHFSWRCLYRLKRRLHIKDCAVFMSALCVSLLCFVMYPLFVCPIISASFTCMCSKIATIFFSMQVMFSLIFAHTYLNICMSFLFADFSVHLTYIIIHGIHYYKFPYIYIFDINLFLNNLFW